MKFNLSIFSYFLIELGYEKCFLFILKILYVFVFFNFFIFTVKRIYFLIKKINNNFFQLYFIYKLKI